MFKKYHLIVLENGENVDFMTKIAANHQLKCLYKIGIYGKEQQHELYVIGKFWNYWGFKKELEPTKRK